MLESDDNSPGLRSGRRGRGFKSRLPDQLKVQVTPPFGRHSGEINNLILRRRRGAARFVATCCAKMPARKVGSGKMRRAALDSIRPSVWTTHSATLPRSSGASMAALRRRNAVGSRARPNRRVMARARTCSRTGRRGADPPKGVAGEAQGECCRAPLGPTPSLLTHCTLQSSGGSTGMVSPSAGVFVGMMKVTKTTASTLPRFLPR